MYVNYRCYRVILRVKHKSAEVRSVEWIFIIGGRRPDATGRIRDIGQNVSQSLQLTADSSVQMRNRWASPLQYWGIGSGFVMTTERLALDLSARSLSLLLSERTVIPSDKYLQKAITNAFIQKWKFRGKRQIFILLLIEQRRCLDSKTQYFPTSEFLK
jgi:hypothetical protein